MKQKIFALALLMGGFAQLQAQNRFDVNGDGLINGSDIAVLADMIIQPAATLTETAEAGVYTDATFRYTITDAEKMEVALTAAEDRTALTAVNIPASVIIGDKQYVVASIADNAFDAASNLTSITIPNTVTTIGQHAFLNCTSLTSVALSNSLTSIGENAFYLCSALTSIELPNSLTTIANYAFSSCFALESVKLPAALTSIGNYAFSSCGSISELTFPNTLNSIGEGAFVACSGLSSVVIPDAVTTIGKNAFTRCANLIELTIGTGVTSIGNFAFSQCKSLIVITALRTDPTAYNCSTGAFYSSPSYGQLHVPEGCDSAYKATAPWSNFYTILDDATAE